jgi:hypothetical protein
VEDFVRCVGRELTHFRFKERSKDSGGHASTGIDRPGVSLNTEVKQASNEREALAFGGSYGIEPEIGEGYAGLAPLDVAQEAIRIAKTWLARYCQHRIVAEPGSGNISDQTACGIEMV